MLDHGSRNDGGTGQYHGCDDENRSHPLPAGKRDPPVHENGFAISVKIVFPIEGEGDATAIATLHHHERFNIIARRRHRFASYSLQNSTEKRRPRAI
jgi:hypothetical protein